MTPLYVPEQAVNWIREHYAFLAKYQMCSVTACMAIAEAPVMLRHRMKAMMRHLVFDLDLPFPNWMLGKEGADTASMVWGRGGEKYEVVFTSDGSHFWKTDYFDPCTWITYTQTLVESPHEHG